MTATTRVDSHRARILAMQLLAQLDVQGEEFADEMGRFVAAAEPLANAATVGRALSLARRCWSGREELDNRLRAVAEHWTLNRMSPADRNIMRVALAELDEGHVPPRVVINEAIEISREYGTDESARFVNGLLDAVYRRQGRE